MAEEIRAYFRKRFQWHVTAGEADAGPPMTASRDDPGTHPAGVRGYTAHLEQRWQEGNTDHGKQGDPV